MDKEILDSLRICLEWALGMFEVSKNPAENIMRDTATQCLLEIKAMSEFKAFWFEGKKFSGWVKTPQMLGKLKKQYPDYLKARKRDDSFDPMFGFDAMWRGITLEEYLK